MRYIRRSQREWVTKRTVAFFSSNECEAKAGEKLCTCAQLSTLPNGIIAATMANSHQSQAGLVGNFFSEAGLLGAFAMRAVRIAFQSPFELREVVHQVYMAGWRSLPLVVTSGLAIGVVLAM